jgi:phosphoribosylformimino-5-aminoimidazole carboxamide ribotide isomerase
MVDLDGARSGSMAHLEVLRDVASGTDLVIDYSGGIRTIDDVRDVLGNGASIVTIGSVAVRSPEVAGDWAERFGQDKFLVGVDVRDGNAATNGWQQDTTRPATAVLGTLVEMGLRNFFVTDISKDGGMQGPATDLYSSLLDEFPDIQLIASGGVRNMGDVAVLEQAGCAGVIIGRALYEGKISVKEAATYAR